MPDDTAPTANRSTAEILRAARARIEDQIHFVMGSPAWNRQGREVDPMSPDAWRWNARGAIWATRGVRPLVFKELSRDHEAYQLINEAAWNIVKAKGWSFPNGTNVDDNLGHALTLQAFDDAISRAEGRS